MPTEAIPHGGTVLLCRLSHIGDCILTLPLANAIRDARTDVRVAWLVESPTDQLLRDHPSVDTVIKLPKGWRRSPRCWFAIRDELRRLNPAVCLDPQSLTKSAVLAWLSGCRRRIGLAAPRGRELAPWLNTELVETRQPHLQDRSLALLASLGIPWKTPNYRLPEYAEYRAGWRAFLCDHHVSDKFVVMNPGGSWASKRWLPSRYGAVAKHLGTTHQVMTVVTWCGEAERAWSQEIVEASGGHGVLAPATDLRQAAELYRAAHFFLGSDTGPMHLAAAVGTRCIVLYGPTKASASGPVGSQHIAIHSPWVTKGNRKHASNEAMRGITVGQVTNACEEMLHGDERQGENWQRSDDPTGHVESCTARPAWTPPSAEKADIGNWEFST
jgi:heptosyltransferase I